MIYLSIFMVRQEVLHLFLLLRNRLDLIDEVFRPVEDSDRPAAIISALWSAQNNTVPLLHCAHTEIYASVAECLTLAARTIRNTS